MAGMPGMSMGGSDGGTLQLLPNWLGVLGSALFLVVLASHLRHGVQTHGERRWWHYGHVLMALSMAIMYLPASVAQVAISPVLWQSIFGSLAVLLLAYGMVMLSAHRAPSALWLLVVLDMGAMVYMWAPGTDAAAIGWIAAGYLSLEALLWASDAMPRLDRPVAPGSYAVSAQGVICVARGTTLTTELDLRVSMCAMTVGMAFMIVAMQLMR